MIKSKYKYIYGPVASWRLGKSLGIDLLSQKEKVCTFDCIYCQVGKKVACYQERKIYVPTQKIIQELKTLPKVKIDYITFSGRGEPTLAKNLGQIIKVIKELRSEPIAILTNSSLMYNKDVRKELALVDFVVCKIDAYSEKSLNKINQPARNIQFDRILSGIKKFRKEYHNKIALQIMFIEQNKNEVERLAQLAKKLRPDEIQINTPLRPSEVNPLSEKDIMDIKKCFDKICSGCKIITVYDSKHKKVLPISRKDTLKRRGKI